MSEELISKRELLDKYEISYGALYRWKRKGLIPEEWFIRKSTVTGQETFFVRDLICARVEEILASRGDTQSLDEMAKKFGAVKEEDARQLIIRMKYGERVIRLADVQSAVLVDGITETDITEQLRALFGHGTNK